MTAISYRDNAT